MDSEEKRGIQDSCKVLRFSYNSFCYLVISKETMCCDLSSIIQRTPKPASRESVIIRSGNLHFIFKHSNSQIFVGCFCFLTSTYLYVHISLFIHVCIHTGIVYSFQKWIMCLKLFLKCGTSLPSLPIAKMWHTTQYLSFLFSYHIVSSKLWL